MVVLARSTNKKNKKKIPVLPKDFNILTVTTCLHIIWILYNTRFYGTVSSSQHVSTPRRVLFHMIIQSSHTVKSICSILTKECKRIPSKYWVSQAVMLNTPIRLSQTNQTKNFQPHIVQYIAALQLRKIFTDQTTSVDIVIVKLGFPFFRGIK